MELTIEPKPVSADAAKNLIGDALNAAKGGKAGDALLGIASLFTSLNAKPEPAAGGALALI